MMLQIPNIDPELGAWLRAAAKRKRLSMAAFLRLLIVEAMEKEQEGAR